MSLIAIFLGVLPILTAVGFRLGNVDLTGDCRFQQLLGFPAPSCGFTRSFVALAGGDLKSAAAYHLFGPILFAGFALCALQGLAEVSLKRSLPYGYRWALFHLRSSANAQPKSFVVGLLVFALCFFLYYVARLYARYHLVPADFSDGWVQMFIAGARSL